MNAATDLVVLGSTAREKDWDGSVKARTFKQQLDLETSGQRAKPLKVMTFRDFVFATGLSDIVPSRSTASHFGSPFLDSGKPNKKYIEPGPGRHRGALLPRTLVLNDGTGVAKGLCPLYIPQDQAQYYWPTV